MNPDLLRNVERYLVVLGVVRMALAEETGPSFSHEKFITRALELGKHSEITQEEVLEVWDEAPSTIVRRGFGRPEPSYHFVPGCRKYTLGKGYSAIAWKVYRNGTKKQVYRSASLYPTREQATNVARDIIEKDQFP